MKIAILGFVMIGIASFLVMGCANKPGANGPAQPLTEISEDQRAKFNAAIAEYENTLEKLKAAYATASDEKKEGPVAEKARISEEIALTEARIKALKSRMTK